MGRLRRGRAVAAVAIILCGLVASASAALASATASPGSGVGLTTSFAPGARLGGAGALRIGLEIPVRAPAVTEIDLRYPAALGIATGGLGLATCRRAALAARGVAGCPSNSVMGYGWARVQARPYSIRESARITLLSGPEHGGTLDLLVYADGEQPASVQLVDPAALVPAAPPYGGALSVRLLPIPGLEGITVALLRIDLSIGARDIVYDGGRGRTYHPDGVVLPARCPAGGLPFRADLLFADRSRASTVSAARCPSR